MSDLQHNIILLDFYDFKSYKKRFQSLFHISKISNFHSFEKLLLSRNEEYIKDVLFGEKEQMLNFFLNLKNSRKILNTPWIIPIIEYMDESFVCTTFPEIKNPINSKNPEYFQTKSFYFFLEDKLEHKKFINLTSGNSLFFFRDWGLKIPITLRFLDGIDAIILKMEILDIPLKTGKNGNFCYDDYNFVYFCNTLKEFWNIIEVIDYKVDSHQFYEIFKKLIKKNLPFMYNN